MVSKQGEVGSLWVDLRVTQDLVFTLDYESESEKDIIDEIASMFCSVRCVKDY